MSLGKNKKCIYTIYAVEQNWIRELNTAMSASMTKNIQWLRTILFSPRPNLFQFG